MVLAHPSLPIMALAATRSDGVRVPWTTKPLRVMGVCSMKRSSQTVLPLLVEARDHGSVLDRFGAHPHNSCMQRGRTPVVDS